MTAHSFSAEESGLRFQISTKPTERSGVMSLAISHAHGEQIVRAEVESCELNRARFTGRAMQLAGNAFVQYKVISNGLAARIGFLFGFHYGDESHSVLVDNDSLDRLLGAGEWISRPLQAEWKNF